MNSQLDPRLVKLQSEFQKARVFAKENPSVESREEAIKLARELEALWVEIGPKVRKAGFASKAGQRQYNERRR